MNVISSLNVACLISDRVRVRLSQAHSLSGEDAEAVGPVHHMQAEKQSLKTKADD